jgi:radical SAM protein with 4Fe4S-binding SPASM domain
MSERKPRIDFEGRTKLETVIPLSTPYLVFLDPSDLCNAKCPHCPTGSGEALRYKKPQIMDFDLYKKIIDDLCEMPEPVKTLRLYKMGEPLLHPYLHKMVKYAYDSQRFLGIDFTTNGTLLTPKRGFQLIEAGLGKIYVSVPGDYDQEYIDRIENFYIHSGMCEVYVKIIGDDMSDYDKERFYNDFGDISDRIFIENRINCWPNFNAGDNPKIGIYGNPLTSVKVCPYPLYSLAINSDGTVSACFLDYPQQMILGDLKVESFSEVWNGQKLKDFRIMQLKGERHKHPFCANCGQLTHAAPDDIDKYADELLGRIL